MICCIYILSCTSKHEKCNSSEITENMDEINPGDLNIYLDANLDEGLNITKTDFSNYAKQLWGVDNFEILMGKPDLLKPVTIWFSTSEDGKNFSGENLNDGYVIKKIESNNSEIFLIYAPDNVNLSFAIYAFLEELGVRFFHPMEDFVPELKGIFLPQELNIIRTSPYKTRGIHLHLLHPIEYFRSFNEAGEENFQEAKRFVDWLVKTGQNYIQWSVLKTLDFSTWIEHAKKIVEYAHLRGVKAGAEIQLLGLSSLQNSYVLADSMDNWQIRIDAQIDFIMKIPWDNIEIGFGEFLSGEPQVVVDMLNYIANYMGNKYPDTTISVVNHVGNYPQLWVNYNNETVFYYHLPKFADPRIINNVHTVFFFDLFRNWGMYNHPDFHLQKDYIMELLPSRVVRYKPESAYWVSADIDVPAFLPEYIYSRWIDINGLVTETRRLNLPMLEGHVLYSSGHEWGYWLTDYLTAKMLWEPEKDFDYFIKYYAKIYGNCSENIKNSLIDFIDLQTTYLFDNKLIPYISGEDLYDDMGYLIGIVTHPRRVQFEELLAMSEEELNAFESNVLDKLQEMANQINSIESELKKRCDGSDNFIKPWCLEIYDGMKIIRLRLFHSCNLYLAVLSNITGNGTRKYLDEALRTEEDARKLVESREKYYRFDTGRLAGSYKNPTIYPFGYLKQAHTLCLWKRQEEQAEYVIANGKQPPVSEIQTCIE